MNPVYVISTGNAPAAREKCILSVRGQTGVDVKHIVLDAAEQHPPRGPIENLIEAMKDIPDDAIVARVDLDDHLIRHDACQIVARLHQDGAWVTHGAARFSDGRDMPWFNRAYRPEENVRTAPWLASHMKTYRCGLFKRLRSSDMRMDGKFLPHARDLLEMYGAIEQAGHDRVRFNPTVIYSYDLGNSFEFNASPEDLAYEKRCVEYVRSLPPYARLEKL